MDQDTVTERIDDCDVLVVGGGIHGVGVAQAAAAAGYRTSLVESRDLAAGTSSKSSKLIHGGLRYLESLEIGLVRESLRERGLLLRLAPELVRRQTFFLPVYAETTRRPLTLRLGLSLYALLADSIVFAQKLHHYHWRVSGESFYQLHAKFEELYDRFGDLSDEFAERILMVGGAPLASLGDALAAAYVECAVDGQVLWGVGIDANIVTASLKAVISAVNRA